MHFNLVMLGEITAANPNLWCNTSSLLEEEVPDELVARCRSAWRGARPNHELGWRLSSMHLLPFHRKLRYHSCEDHVENGLLWIKSSKMSPTAPASPSLIRFICQSLFRINLYVNPVYPIRYPSYAKPCGTLLESTIQTVDLAHNILRNRLNRKKLIAWNECSHLKNKCADNIHKRRYVSSVA